MWKKSVGQLLRGDAKEAEAIARKLFRGKTGRKVMAAVEKNAVRRAAVFDDSKCLCLDQQREYCSTPASYQTL